MYLYFTVFVEQKNGNILIAYMPHYRVFFFFFWLLDLYAWVWLCIVLVPIDINCCSGNFPSPTDSWYNVQAHCGGWEDAQLSSLSFDRLSAIFIIRAAIEWEYLVCGNALLELDKAMPVQQICKCLIKDWKDKPWPWHVDFSGHPNKYLCRHYHHHIQYI